MGSIDKRVRHWWAALPLLTVVAGGCSPSEVPQAAAATPAPAATVATLPTVPATDSSAPQKPAPEKSKPAPTEFLPPFPENTDFFSPPKVPVPAKPAESEKPVEREKPKPAVEQAPAPKVERKPEKKPRPPLRLVGFINVGSQKAILSLDGKSSVSGVGDSLQDAKIVAIKPPIVKFTHESEEFAINLMEQKHTDPPPSAGPVFGGSERLPSETPRTVTSSAAVPLAPQTGGIPALSELPPLPTGGTKTSGTQAAGGQPGQPPAPPGGSGTGSFPAPPGLPGGPGMGGPPAPPAGR